MAVLLYSNAALINNMRALSCHENKFILAVSITERPRKLYSE